MSSTRSATTFDEVFDADGLPRPHAQALVAELERLGADSLVAAGALLGMLVVSDFLRSYAEVGDIPPFVGFMVFCLAFAGAQGLQKLRDRGTADE